MKKVVILLGAPGSGKGSQSKLLKEEFSIAHISTGDMLREEIARQSELGLKVKDIIAQGKFVDDYLITDLLEQRLSAKDCENGFILDGYPRTLVQANLLEKLFDKLNVTGYKVIDIVVSDDIIVKRITGRYTCSSCGEIYNEYFKNPKQAGVCSVCGSKDFIKRQDDNEETLRNRLEIYHKQSGPIIDYYMKKNLVTKIDGLLSLDKAKEEVIRILS